MAHQRSGARWCMLLLAASCVEAVDAPPPAPAIPKTAAEILSSMVASYANASSYEDRGTVTTTFHGSGHDHTNELAFETAFVRKGRFRFEYRTGERVAQRLVIWSDFTHTYSDWTVTPGIVDDGRDLGLALSASAGVSSSSSIMIPSMLMPELLGGVSYIQPSTASVDGTEVVTGHPCWRITGRDRGGDLVTLWIDRDAYLLRKLATSHHFTNFDTAMTMIYDGVIDRPVAEAHLQAPDIVANPPQARAPLRPSPWIGALFEGPTLKIRDVVPHAPADAAGLQAGDEIVAIDGKRVVAPTEVIRRVRGANIGQRIVVTISRNGAQLEIPMTLEAPSPPHE